MTDEDWIQKSLARLETLEAQREQLAASGQAAQLTEIDAEISGLYEALEAVANEDEGEDEEDTSTAESTAAPETPDVGGSPFDAPPAAAEDFGSPFDAPPAGSPFDAAPAAAAPAPDGPVVQPAMMAASSGYDDVDIDPPRSKAPLVIGLLVVLGGAGGGGWYYMQQQKAEAPEPRPAVEAKVIDASAIPEDTQEPEVAKGGAAARTEGTRIKQGSSRPSGPRPSRPRSRRSSGKKSKDSGKIEFDASRDPLGGVR